MSLCRYEEGTNENGVNHRRRQEHQRWIGEEAREAVSVEQPRRQPGRNHTENAGDQQRREIYAGKDNLTWNELHRTLTSKTRFVKAHPSRMLPII